MLGAMLDWRRSRISKPIILSSSLTHTHTLMSFPTRQCVVYTDDKEFDLKAQLLASWARVDDSHINVSCIYYSLLDDSIRKYAVRVIKVPPCATRDALIASPPFQQLLASSPLVTRLLKFGVNEHGSIVSHHAVKIDNLQIMFACDILQWSTGKWLTTYAVWACTTDPTYTNNDMKVRLKIAEANKVKDKDQ